MVVTIIVNYCFKRLLLYAKMLKETKTKETTCFFVTFLSLVAFQLRGGPGPLTSLPLPMAKPMHKIMHY